MICVFESGIKPPNGLIFSGKLFGTHHALLKIQQLLISVFFFLDSAPLIQTSGRVVPIKDLIRDSRRKLVSFTLYCHYHNKLTEINLRDGKTTVVEGTSIVKYHKAGKVEVWIEQIDQLRQRYACSVRSNGKTNSSKNVSKHS